MVRLQPAHASAHAIWRGKDGEAPDGSQVVDTLQQGIETPEHAAFVRQLQEQRSAS